MLRFLSLLVPCFLVTVAARSQGGCQILDEDGEPVPYAHVYLPTVQQGALTDEEGRFELPWDALAAGTPIVFSCLNFESVESTVGEARAPGAAACTVRMQSKPYELGGVEVRADKINFKARTLGVPPPSRFSRLGYNISGRGWEFGLLIENEGRCRLRDINVFVSNVSDIDSFHVEVNLYAYADGTVGEKLQSERIFATIKKEDANTLFPVPLPPTFHNLYVDGPFVATVTMLDDSKEVTTMLEANPKKKYQGYHHRLDGTWVRRDASPSISVVMECPEAR
ncbi:carboxypeptidase-like protein [Neolewinella xylanilytica]|uniref:Carboxypeptidase-like protein n=1 Tax=Neolewinella xylanilytica TaxID=1514080 RepID=A0A2S6I119_9BACT|nr:carboxypeptidase-like regulatory domain-containing protein [Neolewinella xylanilytica]PPK84573.1 carboxypeptidase-like protein [Neolewinella xylanilytica]